MKLIGKTSAGLVAAALLAGTAATQAQTRSFREIIRSGATRIVGGQPTSNAAWPSLVFVFARVDEKGGSACGGTLIAPQWVLTAGHCVVDIKAGKLRPADSFVIMEGMDNLQKGDGRRMAVDRVIAHENFVFPRNDIALLHLAAPAQGPAQLLLGGDLARKLVRNGVPAAVAGFGTTELQQAGDNAPRPGSDQLLEVGVPLVERSDCAAIIARQLKRKPEQVEEINDSTVCAGDPAQEGKGDCHGDSGGPLAMAVDRRRVEVGVVSWGIGCAARDSVGVYTSVGFYEDWIKKSVPEARFVTKAEDAGAPPEGQPAQPAAQPPAAETDICGLPKFPAAANMQVDIAEGQTLRLNTDIHIRARPGAASELLVFNVDVKTCRMYQVWPNKFSKGGGAGSVTAAGSTISIPGAADSFVVTASAPAGANRLYAMMFPPGTDVGDIIQKNLDMRSFGNGPALWRDLAVRAKGQGKELIGVASFNYTIAP